MAFVKIIFMLLTASGLIFFSSFAVSAQTQSKQRTRILLVPMDDRPACLQFTEKMGLIADAEVVSPPIELLGKFTDPGQSDKIISWLRNQNLQSFDAAVVSLDMLAYGGLVAMRGYGGVTSATAFSRIESLREIKRRAPKLPLYVQSVIMRLAPTGDGKNEAYREKLARWAEISPYAELKNETDELEKEIPSAVLTDYKLARERDLKVNFKAIELAREKVVDYLILSQDDAKPRGIHVADREQLIGETTRLRLTEKIAVQPGADEVSMLLLARALNDRFKFAPKIKAIYSSAESSGRAMPYEDRPLRQTVSLHIKAAGAREVENEKEADLLFYVYASRGETGRAASFAEEIAQKVVNGKRVVVADIDPKGNVQGGDPAFTSELGKRELFPDLYGYASWNTAANTIGTALPQGVVFALARAKLMKSKDAARRVRTAQNWFTFHRVLDDFYYHTIVRAEAKRFIAGNKWNTMRLTSEQTEKVEELSRKLMRESFAELTRIYFGRRANDSRENVNCEKPSNLSFALPWNRTFEAAIDFDMQCRVTD